jgi:hypothetical protein
MALKVRTTANASTLRPRRRFPALTSLGGVLVALPLAIGGGLVNCREPTQVLLTIALGPSDGCASAGVPSATAFARIDVYLLDEQGKPTAAAPVASGSCSELLNDGEGTLVLIPGARDDAAVRVDGFTTGDANKPVSVRRSFRYETYETVDVRVQLTAACLEVTCAAGESCQANAQGGAVCVKDNLSNPTPQPTTTVPTDPKRVVPTCKDGQVASQCGVAVCEQPSSTNGSSWACLENVKTCNVQACCGGPGCCAPAPSTSSLSFPTIQLEGGDKAKPCFQRGLDEACFDGGRSDCGEFNGVWGRRKLVSNLICQNGRAVDCPPGLVRCGALGECLAPSACQRKEPFQICCEATNPKAKQQCCVGADNLPEYATATSCNLACFAPSDCPMGTCNLNDRGFGTCDSISSPSNP